MPTAILVDGGFFLRRFPAVYPDKDRRDPHVVAATLSQMALAHLTWRSEPKRELYRIFFYDCAPLTKKAHLPISKRAIDFSRTDVARFRMALHDELRRARKVALRLGHLSDHADWALSSAKLRALLDGKVDVGRLTDDDFTYDARQKGVDMMIGIDIASIAYKRQADQLVLIAGDSDFVPAAKVARREGTDFILDPMWAPIHAALNEHIDGLRSTSPRPGAPASAI